MVKSQAALAHAEVQTFLYDKRLHNTLSNHLDNLCHMEAHQERNPESSCMDTSFGQLTSQMLRDKEESTSDMICRFTKSVIKRQAALTYAEAQSRIDDNRLHDTLSTNLRTMNRIAKILRRQRTER